jgi:hypothetical protein
MSKAIRSSANNYATSGIHFQWDTRSHAFTLALDARQLRVATTQSDLPVPCTFANASPKFITPFEVYYGTDSYLHFRAISDFGAGVYLEWKVAVNVCDGVPRRIVIRHTGGGNVAAYTCYFDGVQQTIVSVVDNLTGSTVPPSDPLIIGNQQGFLSSLYADWIGPFRLYDADKGHAWAVAQGTYQDNPPNPSDANTVLAYDWTGTGTSETDLSSSGFNATLSNVSMRDAYLFPSSSPSTSPSASPSHSPSASPSRSVSSSPSASVSSSPSSSVSASVSSSPSTSPSDAVTRISITTRVTTQR